MTEGLFEMTEGLLEMTEWTVRNDRGTDEHKSEK